MIKIICLSPCRNCRHYVPIERKKQNIYQTDNWIDLKCMNSNTWSSLYLMLIMFCQLLDLMSKDISLLYECTLRDYLNHLSCLTQWILSTFNLQTLTLALIMIRENFIVHKNENMHNSFLVFVCINLHITNNECQNWR